LTIGNDTYGLGGGSTPSNMVTTDTAQDITATKTFKADSNTQASISLEYYDIYNNNTKL
jgi:hypothetical protein